MIKALRETAMHYSVCLSYSLKLMFLILVLTTANIIGHLII